MKYLFIIVFYFLSHIVYAQADQVVAFPGAEGFGKYTKGGRGGKVYIVTNLNDSGFGSLRWALEARGPRFVVFEVSGTIELKSRLNIRDGDLTIAGQTAPGDGITIKNYAVKSRNNDNLIIRFIRFRMGDEYGVEDDAFEVQFCNGLMIDHCSFSWGTDETCSIYNVENATLQNNIISEGLNDSVHKDGPHGFGSLIGGDGFSLLGNLWAHFTDRMPAFTSLGMRGLVDLRNNIVYNWEHQGTRDGRDGMVNLVSNYFKPGPATFARRGEKISHFFYPLGSLEEDNLGLFYLEGNFLEGTPEILKNNWMGVRMRNSQVQESSFENLINKDGNGNPVSFPIPKGLYSKTYSAQEAYENILANVGASLKRDAVDLRVIKEVKSGNTTFKGSKTGLLGIIDSQNDVGGWPELKSLPAPKDTDRDGMPDAWEIANGLDPNKADHNGNDLHPQYTNIEVYINSLVSHIMEDEEDHYEIKFAAEPKEAGKVSIKYD